MKSLKPKPKGTKNHYEPKSINLNLLNEFTSVLNLRYVICYYKLPVLTCKSKILSSLIMFCIPVQHSHTESNIGKKGMFTIN
jgi:hypothetical protein